MRIGLTVLAVLLISALTAALLGPYFVDWSAQRNLVAARLSQILGEEVIIRGAISLRLLPSPYLGLGEVEIDDPKAGSPLFSCDDMKLELGLTALVRGQFRFTQASFVRPTLSLRQGPDGQLLAPLLNLTTRSDAIALENIAVRDGRLVIARAGGGDPLVMGLIQLDAEADSLHGPFKGGGEATTPQGRKLAFHFASGAAETADLPLKAVVDAEPGTMRGEFDGNLLFASGSSKSDTATIAYSGAASFTGSFQGVSAPTPWRASGALKADLNGAEFKNLNIRIGDADRALSADGAARAEFGAAPRANLALSAKQLNLDTLLRRDGEDAAPPARAYEALSAALGGFRADIGLPFAFGFRLDTPAAILGGDTVADVSLSAKAGSSAPLALELEASPPGRSHFRASGAVELGSAAGFKGKVEANVADASRLRDWIANGAPESSSRLAAVSDIFPYRSASATADVDFSAAGLVARNLNLALERSTFTGTLALTRAVGAENARIFLDLRTDALDIDALPNINASGDFAGVDLSLALDAHAIRIARVGASEVAGGSLALKLTKQGDEVQLQRLSLADLGGASVEAAGTADAKGRRLEAKINAARLSDFAALLRRVAPGWASEILVDRAGLLSPANLTLTVQSSPSTTAAGAFAESLAVQGAAGSTRVNAKFDRAAEDVGAINATVSLDAPDTGPLLRQLGLRTASSAKQGQAHIGAAIRGRWGDGLDIDLNASLAGADLVWRGRASPLANGVDSAMFSGAGGVKAGNIAPLLTALAVAPTDPGIVLPVDLSADISGGREGVHASRVKGALGHAQLSGDITYAFVPAQPVLTVPSNPDVALAEALAGGVSEPAAQLEGEVSVDRLPLSALTALALGAPQPVKAGAFWSDAKFSAGLANPPATSLTLRIAALDIANNVVARDAAVKVKVARGLADLDDMTMHVGGAALTGRATIRRDGPNATISGQFSAEALPVARPSFVGQISGAMDFAGGGQSAAALVGELAGTGHIRLTGGEIPQLDPGALGRVVKKAESPDYAIDATNINHALDLEFRKQPLRVTDADASAALTGGVVRFGPVAARGDNNAAVSMNFDLRTLVTEIRAAFAASQTPKYWTGPPPAVSVILKGSTDAPTRDIDSGVLVAGLAAAALARETERIAALESDIRERAFFNRRLKASQFMRRRELELESYALEQARLKSEADRRRVETEVLNADEEKRKAAAPQQPESLPANVVPIPDDVPQSLTSAPPPAPPARPRPANAPPPVDPTAGGLY